jgi:hypothetical protein
LFSSLDNDTPSTRVLSFARPVSFASVRSLMRGCVMEAIQWVLATAVGILLLLVLMLGLLAVGAWLLRWICRIWNGDAADDREP